jgi:signal transduction histidine kinase
MWLWLVAAAAAYAAFGPQSAAYRALDAIDDLAQQLLLLTLIYFSGAVASPLWLLVQTLTLAWLPRTFVHPRRFLLLLFIGHLALAAAFALAGQAASATATMAILLCETLTLSITRHLLAEGLRVRAERDLLEERLAVETMAHDRQRVARDLHDGVGADLVALLLRLRFHADKKGTADAHAISEHAQRILHALRNAVRILRSGQVSLGALELVIAQAAKRACTVEADVREQKVAASAALAAVAAVQTLIVAAAARGEVQGVALSGRAGEMLVVGVDHAGGGRLSATIPLDGATDAAER